MSYKVKHRSFDFSFPASEPPAWASQVERWYQLDAFAFGLPQAASHWGLAGQLKQFAEPTHLMLASPEGSNRTDFDFARSFLKTGAGSPSKFVHTLPNSRSAALLQVLGWYGPLLCLQNDPSSVVEALAGAVDLLRAASNLVDQSSSDDALQVDCTNSGAKAGVWVFAVTRKSDAHFSAHLFEVSSLAKSGRARQPIFDPADAATFFIQSSATRQPSTHSASQLDDAALLHWLSQNGTQTQTQTQTQAQAHTQNLTQTLTPNHTRTQVQTHHEGTAHAPVLALNCRYQISTQMTGEQIVKSNSEFLPETHLESQRTLT